MKESGNLYSKIKICGIRREADIDCVNRFLPDYIGFVFAKSKRQVTPEYVRKLKAGLDTRIETVGVFVNEELIRILNIVSECSLDVVQIHGDESPEYVSELKSELQKEFPLVEIWKAIKIKDKDSSKNAKNYDVGTFVLDTYTEGMYGGCGKAFDWALCKEVKEFGKIVLAGGLNLDNVSEAIEALQPNAVDVSSGVETDGWKDELKIKEFIDKVRGTGGK